MRVVVALGGNALLRRGEELTITHQRRNAKIAAQALMPLADRHQLVLTHGNGPQVGMLAMLSAIAEVEPVTPLDVLDAETEGMIGYLVELELRNRLGNKNCATLLTQVEVDPSDPAFVQPTKFIGPVYEKDEADRLAGERGWQIAADGKGFRRVVASPLPRKILQLDVIRLLVEQGVIVTCSGGGGIPVVRAADGHYEGIEAVIDKDRASALLAKELHADALLMLTDVNAVYTDWDQANARPIERASPAGLREYRFAEGSMGPKVEAACDFVEATDGIAAIGRLADAAAILDGHAGTRVTRDEPGLVWRN